jgi:SAM-dependent methyltransferase
VTAIGAMPEVLSDIAARFVARPLTALTAGDVWAFVSAAGDDARAAGFTEAERARLFHYKRGLGPMLSRQAYYRQAYCRPFHAALQAVGRRFSAPRVLDVCCGTGGQSIAFALAGGSVVGIDRDEGQIDLARRRAGVWQQAAGRELNVEFRADDVVKADLGAAGSYDVIYSHSGIGTFLSATQVFDRFAPYLAAGGLLILKNGNPDCWWLRAVGRLPQDSSRGEYVRQARAFGFRTVIADGTTAIPRPFWSLGDILRAPDALLRPIIPLQVSLQYIFEKC